MRDNRHVARTAQGDPGGRDVLGLAELNPRTDPIANREHGRDAAVVAAIPFGTSTLKLHARMLEAVPFPSKKSFSHCTRRQTTEFLSSSPRLVLLRRAVPATITLDSIPSAFSALVITRNVVMPRHSTREST